MGNDPKNAHHIDGPTAVALAELTEQPFSGHTSKKEKRRSLEGAIEWIRNPNNKPKLEDVDSATAAAVANLAGPKLPKSMRLPKERAKTAADAIEWLQNNDPALHNRSMALVAAITELAGNSMPKGDISGDDKALAVDEALDWIRQNELDLDSLDEPTLSLITDLAGMPKPKPPAKNKLAVGQQPSGQAVAQRKTIAQDKAKELEDAMDWLRSNDIDPSNLDDNTVAKFASVAGIPLSRTPLTAKDEAAKKIEDTLNWVRAGDPTLDDVDDQTLEVLAGLTGSSVPSATLIDDLPKKKAMENALRWIRSNDVQ